MISTVSLLFPKDLNTSHVKLQPLHQTKELHPMLNLNTSHVKLQRAINWSCRSSGSNLNTSHVKLQRAGPGAGAGCGHPFKYISC